ncbi:MAG TPA: hypothetical protein VGM05_10765 [Planctomycetaceae bacterium]
MRSIARGSKHGIKGSVARLHAQVGIQDHDRINHRIENRLRVFAFVNCLLNTGTESGHVGEGNHGAFDVVTAAPIRGQSKKKPPVAVLDFATARDFFSDHLCAKLREILYVRQRCDVARQGADVRWCQAKRFRRGPVDMDQRAVAPDHNDGNIHRVEDADEVSADQGHTCSVALHQAIIAGPRLVRAGLSRHVRLF